MQYWLDTYTNHYYKADEASVIELRGPERTPPENNCLTVRRRRKEPGMATRKVGPEEWYAGSGGSDVVAAKFLAFFVWGLLTGGAAVLAA